MMVESLAIGSVKPLLERDDVAQDMEPPIYTFLYSLRSQLIKHD